MKKKLFAILVTPLSFFSQTVINGKLLDSETKQAVEFANIGIAGKGVGTVSDEQGKFTLRIPDSLKDLPVRISLIGYKEKILNTETASAEILLTPEAISLAEVSVTPNKTKTKILGNKTTSKGISAGFKQNNLGTELAVRLNIRNKETYLKKLMFQINSNTIEHLMFRVNVYKQDEKGLPGENILKQNVIVTLEQMTGPVAVDLSKYMIFADDDVFISLEWVKDLGDVSKLMFSTKLVGSATYFRHASQDKWEKVSPIGVGLHVEVSY